MLDVENATLLLVAGFYRHVLGLVLDLLSRSLVGLGSLAANQQKSFLPVVWAAGVLSCSFGLRRFDIDFESNDRFFGGLCFFVAGDGGI